MTESVPDGRRRTPTGDGSDERSPDNVAPAVAFLASDRSDWCTGQVISARGFQIGLYNVPQVIRQIASPGPWELETAFTMIEESFRPAVEATPRRGG
jgi:hypothetical protein